MPHGLEAADVVLALSDGPPPASLTEGEPLRGTRFFGATTHVWALALGQPGRIVVTAPDVGGASGSGLGYAASGRGPVAGDVRRHRAERLLRTARRARLQHLALGHLHPRRSSSNARSTAA